MQNLKTIESVLINVVEIVDKPFPMRLPGPRTPWVNGC